MKQALVLAGYSYHALFHKLGFNTKVSGKPDIVVFSGGADVSPEYYGHAKHRTTGCDPQRDEEEAKIFQDCLKDGIPMVGICRGGQFLNVMSGGEMYQNVGSHTNEHTIIDRITGETVYVSSTHHQMMKPAENGLLVASSALGGFREWWDGEVFARDVSKEDIEVVWYEHTKCLCFQPHPEFDGAEYEGMKRYFGSLLNRYIFK